MQNESQLTQEFIIEVKQYFEQWGHKHVLVIKHSDKYTIGVPDISFSGGNRRTIWVEVKRITEARETILLPKTWIDKKETIQAQTIAVLNGFYLVFDLFRDKVGFIEARRVLPKFRDKEALQESDFVQPGFLMRCRKLSSEIAARIIIEELYHV